MADAKIKLSITDGTFEIEGPEAFVSKQLEVFGDIIKKALSGPKAKPLNPPKSEDGGGTSDTGDQGDYSRVFEIHDGAVKILSDIPGENDKQKTVNAALLAAFAKATAGEDTVMFDEVREICKQHSCLNAPNFSRYLKAEKKLFLFGGTPRKQTIKLTQPGKKQAEALVDELAG